MELSQEFSLDYAFHWDLPITAVQQESIAAFGNDEDRVRLAQHFSVNMASLESMAGVSSADVRVAVANNHLTPLASLAALSRDRDPGVKAAASDAIAALPEDQQVALRGMVTTPVQRLKSRLSRRAA